MADSLLVKDVMLPAIYLEADITTSKALKLLKQKNVEYGVVGDVKDELFGMVTRHLLRTIKANKPVRDIITNELQVVHTQQDTPLDTIVQSYQENLHLNPNLVGFVLSDKGIVQGILLRELVEKQALQVAVDQIGRNVQELYRRNSDSLQTHTTKYKGLSQIAPDSLDKAIVTEQDEIEQLINEKHQLGFEVEHLQRNVEEMRFTLQSLHDQQITGLEIQHLSLRAQDLREQLESLSGYERILNDQLDSHILLMGVHRLTGTSVGTDPSPPPQPIKVECPICHVKGEVLVYNPRHPPTCENNHPRIQMNPVV